MEIFLWFHWNINLANLYIDFDSYFANSPKNKTERFAECDIFSFKSARMRYYINLKIVLRNN